MFFLRKRPAAHVPCSERPEPPPPPVRFRTHVPAEVLRRCAAARPRTAKPARSADVAPRRARDRRTAHRRRHQRRPRPRHPITIYFRSLLRTTTTGCCGVPRPSNPRRLRAGRPQGRTRDDAVPRRAPLSAHTTDHRAHVRGAGRPAHAPARPPAAAGRRGPNLRTVAATSGARGLADPSPSIFAGILL